MLIISISYHVKYRRNPRAGSDRHAC